MSEFRILEEYTAKFKCSTVYVILFKYGSNFGIEVVDRNESFGRVLTEERSDANLIFSVISKTIFNQISNKEIKSIKDRVVLKENLIPLFYQWL